MGKHQPDEYGFSAVEVIIVILIVSLISCVGFLVYKSHKNSSIATNATSKQASNLTAKTTTQSSGSTNESQSVWSTYTNNTVGFSISYPNTVEGYSECATSNTENRGVVSTSLVEDAPYYYVAAKTSIRFNVTWGANQTYDTSGCTQVPTDATSVLAQNSQIKTGAQYDYSVVNLPFFVKKVSSESSVQTELQNYWNDSTIKISGWQNSSSVSYEVPTAISCDPSEMGMGNNCGPLSSNHDLRYYPTQKIMFYYVQGQAAHLTLTNNGMTPIDSQIVNSFKVLH